MKKVFIGTQPKLPLSALGENKYIDSEGRIYTHSYDNIKDNELVYIYVNPVITNPNVVEAIGKASGIIIDYLLDDDINYKGAMEMIKNHENFPNDVINISHEVCTYMTKLIEKRNNT